MTLGNMREFGVQRLIAYCLNDALCGGTFVWQPLLTTQVEIRRDGVGIHVGDPDSGSCSSPVGVEIEVVNVSLHQEGRSGMVRDRSVISDELGAADEHVPRRKPECCGIKLQHVGPRSEVGEGVRPLGRGVPHEGIVAGPARRGICPDPAVENVVAIAVARHVDQRCAPAASLRQDAISRC
jgi:hypothetical protein